MKRRFLLLTTLLCSQGLEALPTGADVVSGEAVMARPDTHSLIVTTSDKAILNYEQFNIGANERVQFIQPSSNSSVLNRVIGSDPSSIFGSLTANGKVFLVNPNGIYFGPDSSVSTGSLIASILDISDHDFLSENYHFYLPAGSEQAEILNQGSLSAEGSIALLGPRLKNEGTILSKVGCILIAGAKRMTLNFSDSGFLSFAMDEELEETLLENRGLIEAAQGHVHLGIRSARRVIQDVVNTDAIVEASHLIQENGAIYLVDRSTIAARQITIEGIGGKVEVAGQLDVSQPDVGGDIQILGDHIRLEGATLNASGETGGGNIFIGGEYKGGGELYRATTTVVDQNTRIYADAITSGDGGQVIVWADETTHYDGLIFARGGAQGGNGGFVETSGKQGLNVEFGNVYTLAPKGKIGDWLLDPLSIVVATGGSGTVAQAENCADTSTALIIDPLTLGAAGSTVTLCASTSIAVNSPITMANDAVGLIFHAGTTTTLSANILTFSGILTFNTPVTIGGTTTLNTANVGNGANIIFNTTIDGANALTLEAGASVGSVELMQNVGSITPLSSLTITNSTGLVQTGSVKTTGPISYTNIGTGAINLFGNISTTANNGTITLAPLTEVIFHPANMTISTIGTGANINIGLIEAFTSADALTISASNSSSITVSHLGSGAFNPVHSLTASAGTFTNTGPIYSANAVTLTANTITLDGNITTTSPSSAGTVSINGAAQLSTGITIDTTNSGSSPAGSNISFSSTIDGAQALTLKGGTGGAVSFGAVGGTTPLSSLTVTGASVTQNSSAKTTGAISYTGNSIGLGGNDTTSGGLITMTGPVTLNAAVVEDTTNGGATPAGAAITFSNNVTGAAESFRVNGGTGGAVSIGGNLSTSSFTVTDSGSTTITGTTTVPTVTLTNTTGNVTFNGAATIGTALTTTANPYGVIFNNGGTITPAVTFLNTGGVTLKSGTSPSLTFTNGLTSTAGPTTILGTIAATTSGAGMTLGSTTFSPGTSSLTTNNGPVSIGAITLNGSASIATSNGAITLTTVNGDNNFTLNAGTGTVNFGSIGNTTPLNSFTITQAGIINQNSSVNTVGAINYTASAINLGGNDTTSGGLISMNGPVTLTVSVVEDTTNGGAVPAGANITFSSTIDGAEALTLNGGTGGAVSFGAVGSTTPLTSLTATGASVTQNSTVQTTGAINYTGTISLGGNDTTSGGKISMTGPVTLTATVVEDTTNGGAVPAGAAITSSSTIDGAEALTLNGGTGGAVSFGAVGSTTPLTSLTASGASVTQNSSVTTTGAINFTGAISLGGNDTTSGGAISMTGPVTLTAAVVEDSAGGPITFSSNVTGAESFSVNGGSTGVVSIGGNLDTSSFTVIDSASTTITGTTTVPTVTLTNTTGNITFNGAVTISSALITTANPYGVIFNNGGTITPAVTFLNTGGVTLQSGTSPSLTFTNGLTSTAGPTTILGTIAATTSGAGMTLGSTTFSAGSSSLTTNDGAVSIGAITLNGSASIATSNGAITLTTVNGDNNFTLNAGTGTVNFGSIGNTTPLNSFTITQAGIINQNSTVNTVGAIDFTGSAINLGGNDTTSGGMISMTGPVTLTAAVVEDTTNGGNAPAGANITFSSTIDGAEALTLNGGTGGAVSFGAVGSTTPLTSLTASGATVTQNSSVTTTGAINFTGTITLGGNDTTSGGAISMTGPVTLTAAVEEDSAGGPITFSSNVTGAESFSVNGGSTGAVSIGGNLDTSSFTVIDSASTTITGTTTVPSVTLTNTTGDITFNGAVTISTALNTTANSYGVIFNNGGMITPAVNFLNTGGVTLQSGTSPSLTFTNGLTSTAGPTTILGTIAATTSGAGMTLGSTTFSPGSSSLTTNDGAVSIGAITLNGNASIATSGGMITLTTANGVNDLTLNAGTGTVSFDAIGATTPLSSFTITQAGTIHQNSTVNTVGDINYTASLIDLDGDDTTDGGSFTMSGPVQLSTNVSVDTTNGGAAPLGGDITFNSTIDEAFALNLNAGDSTVSLFGNVGGTVRLSSLQAHGNIIDQDGFVHTLGPVSYNSTVLLAGDINTLGSDITINSNVIRDGIDNVTVSTSNGPANILISGTLDADVPTRNLTLLTGSAAIPGENIITLGGDVGSIGPLNDLDITADIINLNSVGYIDQGVAGTLQANATTEINFYGTHYYANNQIYTLPALVNQFNMLAGTQTIFNSVVGPIQFVNGTVKLGLGSDLVLTVQNINQIVENVQATSCESLSIFAGTGILQCGNIGTLDMIGNFSAMAGEVIFIGPISSCGNFQVQAVNSILDPGGALLSSTGSGSNVFLAVYGTVGTVVEPIVIDFPDSTVFAGAMELASFFGVTLDGTIHPFPNEPPCLIYFNNVLIRDCHIIPPPPPPPPPPPIPPSALASLYNPGIYSIFYNLASDYYFMSDFIDLCCLCHFEWDPCCRGMFRRNNWLYNTGFDL